MAGEINMRVAGESSKPLPRKLNFTVAALAGITCPAGKDRLYVYDARVPGLAYVVTDNDSRAFYFVRKLAGRKQRVRLGGREITIEQARTMAAKMNGEIASGIDPAAAKRGIRQSSTLQELFDKWHDDYGKPRLRDRTLITDKSRFDTCFAGWKNRKIAGITESDVRTLHTQIGKDRGHVTANRAVQLLRKLYNFARIGRNPASKAVELFRETSRERFVQPGELPALFKALDDEATNPMFRGFFYLCLYTGARRSNVASMRDEELNIDAATWTIPAEKTKAKQPILLPLAPEALAIIKRRVGHASGFIFPSHGATGHIVEPKATWRKVLERAGLADLRLHDLRRTLGSFQAAAGSSLPIIGKSLGHSNLAATQIYSRLHLEPVRASVTAATAAMLKAAKRRKTRAPRKDTHQ
jgi:integrase